MPAVGIPITILRLPNVKSVGSHRENFQILLRFICFGTCTNQSMQILMTWVHVECRARDLYLSFNVTWQTVDVRKARQIVMKSEIVLNTTYKTHIKNVRIVDHENILD